MAPAAVMVYNLPVMQLVCNLAIPDTPGINITNSAVNLQFPVQYQPAPLPNGYVAFLDIGFAYMFHDRKVTWVEARSLCMQQGAQLALIDSFKKMKYVMSLRQSPGSTHVGIIRMYDDTAWVGVSTGLPVSSLPWARDEPWGEQDCVMISGDGSGLVNNSCDVQSDYVCELPIIAEDNTGEDYPKMPVN